MSRSRSRGVSGQLLCCVRPDPPKNLPIVRFDWARTPGSDPFLVFNTSYHVAEEGSEHPFDLRQDVILNSQAAIAKLTYLLLLKALLSKNPDGFKSYTGTLDVF
jgi:hypothetical protein